MSTRRSPTSRPPEGALTRVAMRPLRQLLALPKEPLLLRSRRPPRHSGRLVRQPVRRTDGLLTGFACPQRPRVLLGWRCPRPILPAPGPPERAPLAGGRAARLDPGVLRSVARVIWPGIRRSSGNGPPPTPEGVSVVPKPPAPHGILADLPLARRRNGPLKIQQSHRDPKVAGVRKRQCPPRCRSSGRFRISVRDGHPADRATLKSRRISTSPTSRTDESVPACTEALAGSREYKSLRHKPQLAPVGAGTHQGWSGDPKAEPAPATSTENPRCW